MITGDLPILYEPCADDEETERGSGLYAFFDEVLAELESEEVTVRLPRVA